MGDSLSDIGQGTFKIKSKDLKNIINKKVFE